MGVCRLITILNKDKEAGAVVQLSAAALICQTGSYLVTLIECFSLLLEQKARQLNLAAEN